MWSEYPVGCGPAGVPLNHNEPVERGFALRQHEYIQTKISQRAVTKGRPRLPEVNEGKRSPGAQDYAKNQII
eukprot:4577500-Lingulodinium_polyedra.AAC.1